MMDPVVSCSDAQIGLVTPGIVVDAPGYVLVRKTYIDPETQQEVEYSNVTELTIRLSTQPPGVYNGRAALTGNGIDRIVVPDELIQLGVLQAFSDVPGWLICAGALARPLEFKVHARTASAANRDIELTLTLEAGNRYQVGPPARAHMTAVELTLDIDIHGQRGNTPPRQVDAYEKIMGDSRVLIDSVTNPQARTRLVLHRAQPPDFPGKLIVKVAEEYGGRDHVILCTQALPGAVNNLQSVSLTIDNLLIPHGGIAFFAQGLRVSGEDAVRVEAAVTEPDGDEHGDYVNFCVDPEVNVRWGQAWVYPEFAAELSAGSRQEGDDRADNLCEAALVIETAGIPLNAPVNVTVHRCNQERTKIALPGLDNLTLDAQGRVVTPTGQLPVLRLPPGIGNRLLWNQRYFYFTAHFPDQDIHANTPDDPVADPAGCLKVKYLHAFVIDPTAGELQTVACRNQVLSEMYGETVGDEAEAVARAALADHRFLRPDLDGLPDGFASWLAVARNTCSYYHFCHGFFYEMPEPAPVVGAVSFHGDSFHVGNVMQHVTAHGQQTLYEFPRHLMFLASCHSALDPRLAKQLIGGRAQCYVIGFRRTITRTTAQGMAARFFDEWLVRRQGDPAQIQACYELVSPQYADVLPCLFSRDSNFDFVPLPD